MLRRRPQKRGGSIYAAAVRAARAQKWYIDLKVPDTVDGRFDMLALHLFLLQNRLGGTPGGDAVMQEVLELFVADMDQNLRELGIGDPSMGRQVRGMVEALHGRFEAYTSALDAPDPGALTAALGRNVFRDEAGAGPRLDVLAAYVRTSIRHLADVSEEALLEGATPPFAALDMTGTEA